MLEALKCLCNIIFNSPCAQVLSTKDHSLEGIVVRLRARKNTDIPHDVKFFTMKMLFLITALGEEVMPELKSEIVMYLTDTLDLILKEAGDGKRTVSSDMKITVSVSTLVISTFGRISCVIFMLEISVLNRFSLVLLNEGRLVSNAHSEISIKRDHVFKQTKVGSKVQYFSYKLTYLFFDIVASLFNTLFPM